MNLTAHEPADPAEARWVGTHSAEQVAAAWGAEVASRVQQIDSGAAECIPWEQVMTEMRVKFG